jgi:tetratricopeptide (TPR) repeat protein
VRNHLATLPARRGAPLTAAALGVALVAGAMVLPAADQPKPPQISAPLQKPLQEVDALLKQNKFPEAIEKLKAVDALPGKAPYDQHVIYQMTAYSCAKTDDTACVNKALQGQIDDGFTSAEDNQKFTRLVSAVSFQLKDYDKAIDYGNKAIKGGFATDETYGVVARSFYLKNDFKNAAQLEESHIGELAKQGQKPTAEDASIYVSACDKLKDNACLAKALDYQVTYYPKPEAWADAISRVNPKGDIETLQTYRLMLETGAMTSADEYLAMANTALSRGSPGDAQRALQAGTAAGQLTGANATEAQKLSAEAKRAVANDQAGLAKNEQDANAASNGVKNAGMGLAYLGYQQYDKAADQLAKAVSKGGLKNEPDTRLSLGIAQLKSGHKDDAIATFQSVKGSPVLEHLASLWVIHAKQT